MNDESVKDLCDEIAEHNESFLRGEICDPEDFDAEYVEFD